MPSRTPDTHPSPLDEIEDLIPGRDQVEAARSHEEGRAEAAPPAPRSPPRSPRAPRAAAAGKRAGKRAGKAAAEDDGNKEKDSFLLPPDLLDRLRNAAFWTPGETKNSIVERALEAELGRMEKARGEAFPKRTKDLPRGRR